MSPGIPLRRHGGYLTYLHPVQALRRKGESKRNRLSGWMVGQVRSLMSSEGNSQKLKGTAEPTVISGSTLRYSSLARASVL